jgi:uncharacterized protein (UPF0261 family)
VSAHINDPVFIDRVLVAFDEIRQET